jgi:hypothetical protein
VYLENVEVTKMHICKGYSNGFAKGFDVVYEAYKVPSLYLEPKDV